MTFQRRTARLYGLLLTMALGVLCGIAPARAAGDDEVIFSPIGDALGAGVVRFRGLSTPYDGNLARPTIKVLVVYVPGLAKPPPSVAYFRVDQSIDCSTHAVSNANYVAWDAEDKRLPPSNTVPAAASAQVPPDLLEGYWINKCPSQQPPVLMPSPRSRGGLGPAPGLANALARARELQALVVKAEHLSTHGHFHELTPPSGPFDPMILIDGDSVSRDGNRLRLSTVTINGPKSPSPQSYTRKDLLIDCDAQTQREEFTAWLDPNGTLVDVSGQMPAISPIYPSNPYDKPVAAACQKFPFTSADRTYATIAGALQASATGESANPR